MATGTRVMNEGGGKEWLWGTSRAARVLLPLVQLPIPLMLLPRLLCRRKSSFTHVDRLVSGWPRLPRLH